MTTRFSWKFLPLAAVLALALLAVMPGGAGQPESAHAAVDCDAAKVSLTVDIRDSDTNNLITAAGSIVEVSPDPVDGLGTRNYTDNGTNDDSSTTGRIRELATCQTTSTTEYTVNLESLPNEFDNCSAVDGSQTTGVVTADETITFLIECDEPNITIIKTATGAGSVEFNFDITGTGSSCEADFALIHQGSTGFNCAAPTGSGTNTFTVTETATAGWVLSSITCDETGEAGSTVTLADRKVVITITSDADDSVVCTFTNVPSTPTVGAASTVQASASPNSVGCNASSFVTLTVRDAAGGAVANGTSVTVTVSGGGSVNPTTTTTTSGGALILYTAPSSGSGTATITATAGTAVGSTTVQFACAATPATAVPPPPPPPASGAISPPNTGDAGLAGEGGLPLTAAGLLAISLLIGGLVAARVRA
jgi:hypothetical protein